MKPYYDEGGITIYHGDCREILPMLDAKVLFADPPYGAQKAVWDSEFSTDWLGAAAGASECMAITPGLPNLLSMPRFIREQKYRWALSIRVINAFVRGALGFGNWIPC